MAKAFHFDDDDNYDKDDSLQNTKENSPQNIEIEESSDDNGSIQESVVLQENENVWEDETMTKKKKKEVCLEMVALRSYSNICFIYCVCCLFIYCYES